MSDTKFTGGEWKVGCLKINGERVDGTWSVNVGGFSLATVTSGPTFGVVDEIQKANAHLISQAPAMYAMLEKIRTMGLVNFEIWSRDTDELSQLLTKARGEQHD